MKVKIDGVRSIYITGEHIKLDALLKFASLVSSGGEAKYLIKNGEVFVNKEACTARGRKIKPGNIVRTGEDLVLVKQSP